MTTFLRPIFSAMLGLTLTIYGLSYSITGTHTVGRLSAWLATTRPSLQT